MASRAQTDSPVLLDPDGSTQHSSVDGTPRWLPLLALLFVVAGGAALIGDNGSDESTPTSTTEPAPAASPRAAPLVDADPRSVSTATIEPVDLGRDHVLVGMADDHYVFVDFLAAEATIVPLEVRPIGIAVAEDRMIYLHDDTGHVEFFRLGETVGGTLATGVEYFAPSAEPGRIWLGIPQVPGFVLETDLYGIYYRSVDRTAQSGIDPRFRYEPGGGVYQMVGTASDLTDAAFSEPLLLGQHVPLATSRNGLLGRVCDADLSCRIEQWVDDGPWRAVSDADAPSDLSATVNAEGTWIGLIGDGITIVSAPNDGNQPQTFDRPEAVGLTFAPFTDLAFVVSDHGVAVLDLATGSEERTDLPDEVLADVEQWIVVTNWTEISPPPG